MIRARISIAAVALATALISPVSHAQTPSCQSASSDPDGDGWGWENSRSCLVSGSTAAASTTSTVTAQPTSSGTPVCQSTDSDQDGDGWGWENNASCVVTVTTQAGNTSEPSTSTPPVTSAPATPAAPAAPSGTPVCTSADADPDGDGWGWENHASCLVTVTTQAATSGIPTEAEPEPTSDIINGLYLGRTAICSSPSSDIDGDGWGFEYHVSCKVVEGYVAPGSTPEVAPQGNNANSKVGIVYEQDFASSAEGLYQADQLNSDWQSPHWHLGFDQGRVSIVDTGDGHGNAMQVTYPAGRYGAGGASAFLSDVQFGMGLPKTYEELYVAYDIRFAEGFDFVRGGKLPGLCGADVTQATSTGCNTGGGYPTGYDGWSARGMWREDGALENYIYHASQRNYYGDSEFWNVSATPGEWHRVEHRVVLNTPGLRNGIMEAWFDGTKVLSVNNLEFRKTNNIGINLFYFSTFFGGNDASWAPSTEQTMNFDNFVLSTSKID